MIIHLINSDPIRFPELNGINNVVYNLTRLQSKNKKVEIWGFTQYNYFEKKHDQNLKHINFHKSIFNIRYISYFLSNRKILRENKAVFHFHNIHNNEYFFLSLLLKYFKLKWVVSPHTALSPVRFKNKSFLKLIFKKAYLKVVDSYLINHAEKIHATSEMEKSDILRYFPTKEIIIIPNGINIASIPAHNRSIFDLKSLTFGYLGRLDISQKGLDTLLKSFSILLRENNKWQLLLLGGGKEEKKLKRQLHSLNLANNVRVVGSTYGIEKFNQLKKVDFYIQLSRFEGFSISVLEAAMLGLPLLTTVECGFKNDIEYFKNGVAFEHSDANKIAKEIRSFIGNMDKSTYEAICQNSIQMAEKYSWNNIYRDFKSKLYYC